jgi:hypothetical protein
LTWVSISTARRVRAARDLVGLDQPARAALARQALGDVEIGREVVPLGDDDAARGRIGAACVSAALSTLYRLTEVESATTTSPARAPISARDLVADALRHVDPAGACSSCGSGRGPTLRAPPAARARRGSAGSTPSELPSR